MPICYPKLKRVQIIGFFVILIGLSLWAYFYFFHVPPLPANVATQFSPAPVPGPDDAYWHYERMLSNFPGNPSNPDFIRLLDFQNTVENNDIAILKSLIQEYQSALDEYAQGADKSVCTLPISPFPPGEMSWSVFLKYRFQPHLDFLPFQTISKIMILRGKLAELENRPLDAVQDYIRVIRTGQHLNQTTLVSRLVGLTIRNMGITALLELLSKPNSIEYADSIFFYISQIYPPSHWDLPNLSDYEISPERRNDILASPREAKPHYKEPSLKYVIESTITRKKTSYIKHDMVYLLSAIRLYQYKNQTIPNRLEQLTPYPLVTIPTDPFSGTPYIYHPDLSELLIYSIGPDETDNRAQIIYDPTNGIVRSSGDIVIEISIR